MKRFIFLEGLGIALLLALLSIPASFLASLWLPGFGLRASLSAATVAYLFYLLSKRERQAGNSVLGLAILGAGVSMVLIAPSLTALVMACAGLIWLVRSLLRYRSLITAALDGGLSVCGAAFSLWAFHASGSVTWLIWSFFLVQAVTGWIPERLARTKREQQDDRFGRACETAEEALSALVRRSRC